MRQGLLNVINHPNTKSGNYRSERNIAGNLDIKLFGNRVATIDDNKKVLSLTHAGWYTSTTNRTLISLRKYYGGYTVIEEDR